MFVSQELNGFGPLTGIKVVELCEWVAAPSAARCMAEMGAEVIKVENPVGDPQRSQGSGYGCNRTEECDPTYDMINAGKDFLSLNLKNPEAMDILMDLLADADVFICSMRDKALVKLGLDFETLHEKFPRLVWCQMRGYGEFGEYHDKPGFDAVCWGARGGVMSTFPQKGESPAVPPQSFGDLNAGAIFVGGILAAVIQQQRTGKGDKVTINLYHVAMWAHACGLAATQFGVSYPGSRAEAKNPFNNTYRSKDGVWFLICMPDYNRYFNQMMEMLGQQQLIGNDQLDTLASLKESGQHATVVSAVSAGFATKNYDEWDEILIQQQVPHQKLYTYDDILADKELYDNDALRSYGSTEYGQFSMTTSPIRFGSHGNPPIYLTRPTGYHTAPYLKSKGYSDERIAELEASGAIRCWHGGEVNEQHV